MPEDEEHRERLLRMWAVDLDRKGFTDLQVDLERFPMRPEGWEISPDIVARRHDGKRLVGVVWSCGSIDRGQQMFSRLMSYSYHGDVVMLLVPFDCLDEADEMVREWGLSSEVFVQGIID
ncbi:MAG: hypothetical protein LUQ09_06025 [Methanomassiliicoccales archaeon]|nr:hypothetical protein [Methanomassiliicoccales archaeon]